MNYFERMLLNYLRDSKIRMEITGFDMDGFESAVHDALKLRLDAIECIVFEDGGAASDAQKVAAIRNLFQREFYDKE